MPESLRPIVLIDDNADDLVLLARAIERADARYPHQSFDHGVKAMAYLDTCAVQGESAVPLACFVDINMLGFEGAEFIEWVRKQDVFKRTALIVASGSEDPQDLLAAFKLGAQCYVTKFPPAAAMREILQAAENFSGELGVAFQVPGNLFVSHRVAP